MKFGTNKNINDSNDKSSSNKRIKNNDNLIGIININNEKKDNNKNIIEKSEKMLKLDKKNKRESELIEKSNLNKNLSKTKTNSEKNNYLIDYELNRLQYKEALQIDKRSYFQYYLSLLKIGNLFFFSFIPNKDYNSMILKITIFSFHLVYIIQ